MFQTIKQVQMTKVKIQMNKMIKIRMTYLAKIKSSQMYSAHTMEMIKVKLGSLDLITKTTIN